MLLGILIAGVALLTASSANAATLSVSNGSAFYIADQGERNDVDVAVDTLLGFPVYTFTDNDATPITLGVGNCELVNGIGMCSAAGVAGIFVNARDQDDTIKVAIGGPLGPVNTANTLIGGRGNDTVLGGNGPDRLKGNNGRDSLRGRRGADFYKGGRGSDTLQTLYGAADAFISCVEGRRDLLRADASDPAPKSCELGNRSKRGKRR